jgi:hypothetical protein
MSNRWPGGLIRKTPVTPAGPLQNGAAPGIWTLAEASYWVKQGLWPTQGNTLAVEDVFSTWLYTGTGAAQTITNGINLSGQGGMVWIKSRSAATNNFLFDTTRGVNVEINSNTTEANVTLADSVTAFNSNGFAVGSASGINDNGSTFASWTFREAPNFFDVVTYTGDAVAGRAIAHSLGSAPGCIIVKELGNASQWFVYHRSLGATNAIELNNTGASYASSVWNNASPTATEFYLGSGSFTNRNGGTYVAYLFAHVTASDGIIQCGSFTTDGSGYSGNVELGWEPQWVLIKNADATSPWLLVDNMRGWINNGLDTSDDQNLRANVTDAEATNAIGFPYATGFNASYRGTAGQKWIYIAIRRGPMKTPTLGTSVFTTILQTPQSPNTLRTIGFPADFIIGSFRTITANRLENTRLTGFANTSGGSINTLGLFTNTTGAESSQYPLFYNVWNTTARDGDYIYFSNGVNWFFRRAPGFMDVVCYTGTGVTGTQAHNLGVVPELMIVKRRTGGTGVWPVYYGDATKALFLNETTAIGASGAWGDTAPTATQFTVNGASSAVNAASSTYVSYLFASVPGVSKVGSYTGNGSSQTINCVFTTGARFVMIKRTDSTGDWYVWDSARGIVAGNDPYLALNDTAVEVTSNDSVDTDNTGFIVNQVSASNVNVSAATYIFLAIA